MKNILRGCTVATVIVGASNAAAGGLWLNDFGDFSSGRAAAGAAAGTDEAMTIAYNPASISRLQGSQLFVAAGAIIGDLEFDISNSNPRNGYQDSGSAGEVAPAGALAYVHDLGSDRWSAGIALGGLSGAGMDYNDNWVGRYQATKVSLLVMSLSPTVSYRVTDKLSLGVSVQALYGDLELDFAVPNANPSGPDGDGQIDGDDVQPGFTLGAMYELSDTSRFGLFYQSEINLKFDGDLKVSFPFDNGQGSGSLARSVATDTELDLAQYVRFAVHQDMNERWGVDFTVGWDDWSALDNVFVSSEDGSAGIPTKWRDTYHVAWGTQYKLDENWELTGGVAYDSNPVKSRNRNAQLPVDRQIRYALGTRYRLKDSLTVGGNIVYMDLGEARINNNRFSGDYDSNSATQIIVNMTWRF